MLPVREFSANILYLYLLKAMVNSVEDNKLELICAVFLRVTENSPQLTWRSMGGSEMIERR